jgi:hypothetical protein
LWWIAIGVLFLAGVIMRDGLHRDRSGDHFAAFATSTIVQMKSDTKAR